MNTNFWLTVQKAQLQSSIIKSYHTYTITIRRGGFSVSQISGTTKVTNVLLPWLPIRVWLEAQSCRMNVMYTVAGSRRSNFLWNESCIMKRFLCRSFYFAILQFTTRFVFRFIMNFRFIINTLLLPCSATPDRDIGAEVPRQSIHHN